MSGDVTRREFVAGAVAVSLALASKGSWAAAESQLMLFDPDLSRPAIEGLLDQGCKALPIVGDRVRFARALFTDAPAVIAGVTHYADYILLTGCAAEHGYRIVSERAAGQLVTWRIARRTTYSG